MDLEKGGRRLTDFYEAKKREGSLLLTGPTEYNLKHILTSYFVLLIVTIDALSSLGRAHITFTLNVYSYMFLYIIWTGPSTVPFFIHDYFPQTYVRPLCPLVAVIGGGSAHSQPLSPLVPYFN